MLPSDITCQKKNFDQLKAFKCKFALKWHLLKLPTKIFIDFWTSFK